MGVKRINEFIHDLVIGFILGFSVYTLLVVSGAASSYPLLGARPAVSLTLSYLWQIAALLLSILYLIKRWDVKQGVSRHLLHLLVAVFTFFVSLALLLSLGPSEKAKEWNEPLLRATSDEPVAGFLLQDSIKRYLMEADISDMPLQVINYAKNEMYARHGRIFQSEELAGYFASQPWYHGRIHYENFDQKVLFSEMEQWNFQLLTQMETRLAQAEQAKNKNGYGYHLDSRNYSYAPVYEYLANHPDKLIQNGEVDPVRGYILPYSSTEYLTEEDLDDMPLQVINYAKNELQARHGKIFLSKELDGYFSQEAWYNPKIPSADFVVEKEFNEIELHNHTLLIAYSRELGETLGLKKGNSYGYELDQDGFSYEPVYEYKASKK